PVFEIYSDRIEITSTGGLGAIKNKEDFFTGFTKPINRELMRIFKDVELVEHLGSGMGRILPAYGRDSFQITDNFMRLVFYKANLKAEQETNDTERYRTIPNDTERLSAEEKKVVDYLSQNKRLTRAHAMELLQLQKTQ